MTPIIFKNASGLALLLLISGFSAYAQNYPVIDTGQIRSYNNTSEIPEPSKNQEFYGQDAHYRGHQPSYIDNGNGTVTDKVSGLMWLQSVDRNGDGKINASDKQTYDQAVAGAKNFKFAGYTDWRLPTIKEAYSLILFSGEDVSGYQGTTGDGIKPFIDENFLNSDMAMSAPVNDSLKDSWQPQRYM